MSRSLARRRRAGTAAVEMSLLLPVLLPLIGGTADFGLAFWYKGMLASSVAQGRQYATLAMYSGMAATGSGNATVRAIVQRDLSLPASNVSVSYPTCFCPTGYPLQLTAATCGSGGSACPDGTTPAYYVTITASYTYKPVMPFYSKLASTNLTESAVIRLQQDQ